jgi:hypothetical protein
MCWYSHTYIHVHIHIFFKIYNLLVHIRVGISIHVGTAMHIHVHIHIFSTYTDLCQISRHPWSRMLRATAWYLPYVCMHMWVHNAASMRSRVSMNACMLCMRWCKNMMQLSKHVCVCVYIYIHTHTYIYRPSVIRNGIICV